jgi:hypothetical protein
MDRIPALGRAGTTLLNCTLQAFGNNWLVKTEDGKVFIARTYDFYFTRMTRNELRAVARFQGIPFNVLAETVKDLKAEEAAETAEEEIEHARHVLRKH